MIILFLTYVSFIVSVLEMINLYLTNIPNPQEIAPH